MQRWGESPAYLLSLAKRELAAVIALLVMASGALVFVELIDEIEDGESHEIDRAFMLALRAQGDLANPIGPTWLQHAMVDITSLGSTTCLTLVTVFTCGLLLFRKKRLEATAIAVSVGGAAIVMSILKDLFARSRPDVVPHLVEVFNESFPSGHAMVSAAAYLTLGTLGAHASDRRVGTYLLSAAVLLVLLIGVSRVYLGVHWPTDVLAGWCAGAAWAMGCWLVTVWVQRRTSSPSS